MTYKRNSVKQKNNRTGMLRKRSKKPVNQAGGGFIWDSPYEKVSKQITINTINKTMLNGIFNKKEIKDKYKEVIFNYLYNILIRFYKYYKKKTISKVSNALSLNKVSNINVNRAFSVNLHKTDTLNATTKYKLYKTVSKDVTNQPHYDEINKYFYEFITFLLNVQSINTFKDADGAYNAAVNNSDNMKSTTSQTPSLYYAFQNQQSQSQKHCQVDTCYLRPTIYKLENQSSSVTYYSIFGKIHPETIKRELDSSLYDFIRTVRKINEMQSTETSTKNINSIKSQIPERISNMKLALDAHAHAFYWFICYMYNRSSSISAQQSRMSFYL